MPFPESTDLPIEIFGGYCTSIPPSDLPPGASPLCQDVQFPEASVKTRDGILAITTNPPIGPFASVNGLANYGAPTLQNFILDWDSSGSLYQIDESGNLLVIKQSLGSAGLFMNSTNIFGRQYMAFANGTGQADFPRQWDGVNIDRVSQCGPGQAPTVADGDQPAGFAISTAQITSFQIFGISQDPTTGIVTLVTDLGFYALQNILLIGDDINVTATVHYNGTWQVTAVGANFVQFFIGSTGNAAETAGHCTFNIGTIQFAVIPTQAQLNLFTPGLTAKITGASISGWDGSWVIRGSSLTNSPYGVYVVLNSETLGASVAGIVQPPSNITAGLRGVTVAFITRQGYITKLPPPNYWTAGGGLLANVTQIPTGPSNIVARLLLFTLAIQSPATTGTFFSIEAPVVVAGITYSSAMLIPDNVTTTAILNFRDTDLAAGFNGQYLFTLIELGRCSGVTSYSSRTVWTGELNRIRNILNFSFNGGWSLAGGTAGSDVPLGWSSDPVSGGGARQGPNQGLWLDAYRIGFMGGGLAGMITQPIVQDYLGVSILAVGTQYSARIAAYSTDPGACLLTVDFFSPTVGQLAEASYFVPNNTPFVTTVQNFTFPTPAVIPPDTVIRIYGFGPNGQTIVLDSIEIFPTNVPVNSGIAWISYADNPESFDGTLSQVQVRPNDGQALRGGFTIRGNLYLGKERYLAYTTDTQTSEPSGWNVSEVSNTIGFSGPNAVDTGEEWAVFANRNGAYMFWGSDPVKLTQEFQIDASNSGKVVWNSINWNAATTIWCKIDNQSKRILIGTPTNGASLPNIVWQMDYKFAASGEDVAPGAVYSAFMNKLITHGGGMKWAPWNIAANCCCIAERADGTQKVMFGSGLNDSRINQLTPGQLSDNGNAINSIYQTYGQPSTMEEEQMQLKSHQKLTDYVTGRAAGAGFMALLAISALRTTPVRAVTLSANPTGDFERNINDTTERLYWQVGTNAVGEWFQLEKLIAMQKVSPTMPVRGIGA